MPRIKIIATGGTISNSSHGLIGIDDVLKDIPESRGKGVLVVLHEEIHSAREVLKTNQRISKKA